MQWMSAFGGFAAWMIVSLGEPPTVVVELVDGAQDSESAPALTEAVAARIQAELDARVAADGQPLPSPDDGQIAIVISPMPAAPGEDFLVRVVARSGEEALDSSEPLACVACGERELAELAIGVLPARLDALAERAPVPPPAPVIDETDLRPSSTPHRADARPSRPAGSGRPLTIAGMVSGVAGAGLLGVGIGMLVIGDGYRELEPSAGAAEVTDYRPMGGALAGIGGAALITGAVCFGLGLRRLASARAVAERGPSLGPGGLTLRF